MPQTILTGSTLAAGLRSDFQNTWRQTYDGIEKELGSVMALDVPMDRLTETFAYRESLPVPALWLRGDPVPVGGLGSVSYSATAFDYARRISWHRNDRHDNQIGNLYEDARALGARFARLDSKAFAEFLLASASLLPNIPNAPDGAALASATNGAGGDRFGVSGGNIISGSGVATSSAIETDLFAAFARFDAFQDTASEPLYEPDLAGEGYVIYANAANRKVFTQALAADTVHSVVSSTGAAVSNVVLASGAKVMIHFTQRITDNDWHIFRTDAMVKPIASGLLEPLREEVATADNSDLSRDTGEEYIQFIVRKAYWTNIPYGYIKVNN